eukprot:TRINITY_DN1357_c0_g1_i2.p1 TRINITY_DN1357_c0_g1~~TRINITY_DN1357_c0_g1_i2.p1  ORF type:complete len:176 (-),score=30.69 TRINITY_DN1357_c0_g1_i2:22-549(-)
MFGYVARVGKVLAKSKLKEKIKPLDTTTCEYRVRFRDLDINFHMNNSRYVEAMEMSRIDYAGRTGLPLGFKYQPLLGSVHARYLYSLTFGNKYSVTTKLAGATDKWIYMNHEVHSDEGRLCAFARVKFLMRDIKQNRNVPTSEIAEVLGLSMDELAMQNNLQEWVNTEERWRINT